MLVIFVVIFLKLNLPFLSTGRAKKVHISIVGDCKEMEDCSQNNPICSQWNKHSKKPNPSALQKGTGLNGGLDSAPSTFTSNEGNPDVLSHNHIATVNGDRIAGNCEHNTPQCTCSAAKVNRHLKQKVKILEKKLKLLERGVKQKDQAIELLDRLRFLYELEYFKQKPHQKRKCHK